MPVHDCLKLGVEFGGHRHGQNQFVPQHRRVPTRDAWVQVAQGGLPVDDILGYCEKWRDRFNLFGGTHPFLQAPTLHTTKDEVSGLEKIIADVPNGVQFFTTRNGAALERISAAEAALWLLHAMAYDPSGLRSGAVGDLQSPNPNGTQSPIGPSWAGQVGMVILRGETLDETLVLNLVPPDSGDLQGPRPWETPCIWEDKDAPTAVRRDYAEDPPPIAISRILTWPSRRIRLVGSRSAVTGVVLTQGDKLDSEEMQRYEPMGLWQYSGRSSKERDCIRYKSHLYEPGRALWRSIPEMLPTVRYIRAYDKSRIPEFLTSATLSFRTELASVYGDDLGRVRIQAIGVAYGGQKATIEDIYYDEVAFSTVLFSESSEALGLLVDHSVEVTEGVAIIVAALASNLARAAGAGGGGDRERARELFYAAVDGPYREWLVNLDDDSDIESAKARWDDILRSVALSIAQGLIRATPDTAQVGRKISAQKGKDIYMNTGTAETKFWKELGRVVPRVSSMSEGDKK